MPLLMMHLNVAQGLLERLEYIRLEYIRLCVRYYGYLLTCHQLVSSRQLTTFSDYRMLEASDFLLAEEYCAYLEGYCNHFKL